MPGDRVGTGLPAFLQYFPGAVLEISPEGTVRESNGGLDSRLQGPVVGRTFAELLEPASRSKWHDLLGRDSRNEARICELVLDLGASLELFTFALIRAHATSGEEDGLWLFEYSRNLQLEELYEKLAMANSELVGTQRALKRERVRLSQALKEAEAARRDAEQAVRSRDEVLAIVAHDLRNPLDRILTSASMLLDSSLSEANRHRLADVIKRSAVGTDQLLRDLLDAASIDAGRLAIERRKLEVRPLVEESLEMFLSRAAEGLVDLKGAIAPDLPSVWADPGRIRQALGNLLSNAVRLTSAGGRIDVAVQQVDGFVKFSVSDTGPGIASDALPLLFERFWQAGSHRRGSAGLGLSITKGIVEAHGGNIGVESVPGEGSTFHFTLPVCNECD